MKSKSVLSCPECKSRLSPVGICPLCKKGYVYSGIYEFLSRDTLPEYQDTAELHMLQIIEKIKKGHNWEDAIYSTVGYNDPWLFAMLTDDSRADGQFLLPLHSGDTVLDVGSGMGVFSIPLAHRKMNVISLEPSRLRLEFAKLRAKQEDVDKSIVFVHASATDLPIIPKSCDAVIVNGVLEWLGVFGEGDIQTIQKNALQDIHSVLKPGGYLYVGIENRIGLKYLLGEPEDHVNLPYISVLNRNDADEMMISLKKQTYETLTYNKNEYLQLFQNAGFKKITFYLPYPDYKLPTLFFNNSEILQKHLASSPEKYFEFNKRSEWFMSKVLLQNADYEVYSNSFIIIGQK